MGELEHLVQADVGHPDVAAAIDGDAVRDEEGSRAPRGDELAALLVELEDRWLVEQFGGARLEAAAGPVEDEHMAAPVDIDAGDFAELHARRQARPVLDFLIRGRRCAIGPSALLGAGQPGGERDDG